MCGDVVKYYGYLIAEKYSIRDKEKSQISKLEKDSDPSFKETKKAIDINSEKYHAKYSDYIREGMKVWGVS